MARRRKLTARQRAELKRDPHDLVLTGKGTAAQERKRDPNDLLIRKLAHKRVKNRKR